MDTIVDMLGSTNIHDLNSRWGLLFRVKERLASREDVIEFTESLTSWAANKNLLDPGMNDVIAALRAADPSDGWDSYHALVMSVARKVYECVHIRRA